MHVDSDVSGIDPDSELVAVAVELFSMLADATRVRIVLALARTGELSVNHLADLVDKSPTAVSQHLAKLRLARMVTKRQQGTSMFYRLTDEHPAELVAGALRQAEHAVAGAATPVHHRAAEPSA